MALRYPGVAEAAAAGIPPRFTLEDLARCPDDSLGGSMHSFVVDNGFDLEVLDRDSLGLRDLPYPLDYVNVRILQCHDIWHLVADHKTSGLHEVSVSGFQMAQFGHQYSSMFLGMVLAKVAFTQPDAFAFTLDTILTGYRHGRETPPLLGVGVGAGVGPADPRDPRGARRHALRLALPGLDPRGAPGPAAPQRLSAASRSSDRLRYFRMLTARAMTRATVSSEASDCTIIRSFAHGVSGMVSVGLNAVALVNEV